MMDEIENLSLSPAKNGFILRISGRKKNTKSSNGTYDSCMSYCSEEEVYTQGQSKQATDRMMELSKKMFKEEDEEGAKSEADD